VEKHQSGIPILTYHSLDNSGSVISTSPSNFERQMESLWRRGYRTISLSEAAGIACRNTPSPAKTFVVTFDDGYQNVYSKAVEVLGRFGFKATVFLITDYCGRDNDWPGQPSSIQRRPLLSWSQIREMSESGFEIGVHTATHPDLTTISVEGAEREITRSKSAIEDRLGIKAEVFAYPYGRFNSKVLELVRSQFNGACSTKLGKLRPGCDPYLLKRVDMYYFTSSRLFDALPSRAMDWYLGMRNAARVLREGVV
jgi:peptidoglycan/xylan/chitin deacetylase (PgdA/CDA1 family)